MELDKGFSRPPSQELALTATDKLKQYRLERTWTQEEMAAMIRIQCGKQDFSRPYYARLESGSITIDPEFAVNIARVLHLPVDELFTKRKGRFDESDRPESFTRG